MASLVVLDTIDDRRLVPESARQSVREGRGTPRREETTEGNLREEANVVTNS